MASAIQALSSSILQGPTGSGISLGVPNPSTINVGVNPTGVANISQPAKPVTAPAASAGGGGSTTPATGGSAGYSFNQPQYLAGITQEYEGQLAADQRQAEANDAFYGTNKNLVEAQYGANKNQVNQQANDSLNTLDTQAGVVGSQQRLSLAELADQIHGQHTALLNELGTVGAGSSSAVGTGEEALAHVQNSGRADINQSAGGQISNINAEKQAVTDQQKTQLDALDVWRQQQLTQIMQLYQQNQNAIDSAIQTAQGEEKARLAQFGVALQEGVSAALQALDKQVQDGVKNITNYQIGNAPTIAAPVATPTPGAITAPVVSPFNVGNGGAPSNATATPTGGSVYALKQQNQ